MVNISASQKTTNIWADEKVGSNDDISAKIAKVGSSQKATYSSRLDQKIVNVDQKPKTVINDCETQKIANFNFYQLWRCISKKNQVHSLPTLMVKLKKKAKSTFGQQCW